MGNKVITGVCTRDESLDVEDFSSADFDFISAAVRSGSACATPSSRAFVPASKMVVAVLPVDLSLGLNSSHHHSSNPSPFDKVRMKPATPQTSTSTSTTTATATSSQPTPTPATDDEPELSFNDRLNMLTWDPEDFALPTRGTKRQRTVRTPGVSISKPILSTSRRPTTTSPEPAQLKRKTPFGWLSRAISNYKMSPLNAVKKQAKDLQKTKKQQQDDEDKQQQKMFKTQASSIKTSINQDQPVALTAKQLTHDDNTDADYEDPISDTESESSATELSFCNDNKDSTSSSSTHTTFAMAYSFSSVGYYSGMESGVTNGGSCG